MQDGFFDDKRKEYVIETPATPMPWINYLGSQEFFSLISNTAGGYCFYRDAKLQRILRYRYNNVPADVGGRFFYIKEEDKAPWSPTFHPVDRSLDSYRCRHGMGYTVFETEKDGLYAELTFLVPIGENCEVQRVRLTNRSAETKRFRFTAAVEWCLWNTVDDATNFQRNLNIGELEVEGSAIYHKTEYRERRNHYAYYGVNAPIAGYDTDRDHFLGTFGTFARPQAILSGKTGDFVAHGGAPMAGLALDVTLAPGEERGFVFVLGYGKNPRGRKFLTPGVIRTVAARASYDEGAARNSWLTGTAAWTFVNISQYILGVKPTPAGLRIDPCLPGALEEYSVRRRYRGAAYHIHVVQTGTYSLRVDGENVAGNLIPMKDGKKKYHVEVTV